MRCFVVREIWHQIMDNGILFNDSSRMLSVENSHLISDGLTHFFGMILRFVNMPVNKHGSSSDIHKLVIITITIINCSLNNPGPNIAHTNESNNNYVISDRLSIYYQNVQGLIPFTEFGKAHPNLDNTKICELLAYVYDKKPDVIILNETWRKSTILDGEILPTDKYKIFRCDRTDLSHPPDPENASKFKKNGGWCPDSC